jgi:hypothetical protein
LLREGRFDEALAAIQAASNEKQLEKLLEPLRERAQSLREAARQIKTIRAVLDKDGPAAALRQIDGLAPELQRASDVRSLRDTCERRQMAAAQTRFTPTPIPERPAAQASQPTVVYNSPPTVIAEAVPSRKRTWKISISVTVSVLAVAISVVVLKKPASQPAPESAATAAAKEALAVEKPKAPEPPAPAPEIRVSPGTIEVEYRIGSRSLPPPRTIAIDSTGDPISFSATVADDDSWITLAPADGKTPASLTVGFRLVGLSTGVHTGRIRVTADSGKSSIISVKLSIQPNN